MPSPFGIHDRFIRDNESRAAGADPRPIDRQLARTKLHYNFKGQISRVDKITGTTVNYTEFFYDDDNNGRLIETWTPLTCTRKVMVYDENGKLEDTITYRVADR